MFYVNVLSMVFNFFSCNVFFYLLFLHMEKWFFFCLVVLLICGSYEVSYYLGDVFVKKFVMKMMKW